MKNLAKAAVTAAALATAGCSSYHPASLSEFPYGVAAARDRAVADPSLGERYPSGADVAENSFPQGAHAPVQRPAGQAMEAGRHEGWSTTSLGREAERKSIARDIPHAVVVPEGTAKGF